MPKSIEKVLRHLSAPQRKVIEAVASIASMTLSEINPPVGVGDVIANIEHHDGISETRTALQQLVERGILVKEVHEGSYARFKFSEAVVQAGGFKWIMGQITPAKVSSH